MVDRASEMLEPATNDYGRLYVLHQALTAAHVLKIDAVVKANPTSSPTEVTKRIGFQIHPFWLTQRNFGNVMPAMREIPMSHAATWRLII